MSERRVSYSISVDVIDFEDRRAQGWVTVFDVPVNLVDGTPHGGVAVGTHLLRLESAHSDHMCTKIGQTIELYGTLWTEIRPSPEG